MANSKKQLFSMGELVPLMRESLEKGQSVHFSPKGVSMLPMLREDLDSVVLSPIEGKLKKYDLPLYERESGKYILHRIVEVGDGYTCMGDNQFIKEPGLSHDQMIAVVTGFYRGDKFHSVEEPAYKLYCRAWYHSRHIRRFIFRVVRKLKRCIQ